MGVIMDKMIQIIEAIDNISVIALKNKTDRDELLIAAKMALESIRHAGLSEFNIPETYLKKAIANAERQS